MDVRFKHVVAVAMSGSFTAAAELVGVTQSAVTRGVANLERQLGYDLFYRTARGALLTDKGRNFAERVARLLDDERELLKGDLGEADPFFGVLRIGVSPASLEWMLTRPVTALKIKHPTIRFEIVGAPFERMAPMLRNGGVDVVLGFEDAVREWSDLKHEPAGEFQATLFARKGHPLLNGRTITAEAIVDYELVSLSDSRPHGAVIRALYESQGVDWRKRLHVIDYFPIVRKIVENSDALGVVAHSHATLPAFRERFATLDASKLGLFAPTPICCATRMRWEASPAARTFIFMMRTMQGSLLRTEHGTER